MGSEQKRAFLAVILSGIVLFAWQFYFAPKVEKPITQKSVQASQKPSSLLRPECLPGLPSFQSYGAW